MSTHQLHVLEPTWRQVTADPVSSVEKVALCTSQAVADYCRAAHCTVLQDSDDEALLQKLLALTLPDPCILLDLRRWTSLENYNSTLSRHATQDKSFRFFKKLATLSSPVRYGLIHHAQDVDAHLLTGIALSLAAEQEAFSAFTCSANHLGDLDLDSIVRTTHPYLRVHAHNLERLSFESVGSPPKTTVLGQGVYLITGNGGITKLLARYLKAQYGAQVIVVGRRTLDTSEQEDFQKAGAETYLSVDMGDKNALQNAWQFLKKTYGEIRGVFHLAGVIEDALWTNKTQESFARVLYPKTQCLENLDEAIGNAPLDVFVCFASLTGILGNTGQADYAAANAWMNAFCERRHRRVMDGQRQGRTRAISWGLWEGGGMQAHLPLLSPLKADKAFRAMEVLLQTNEPLGCAFKGDLTILQPLVAQKTHKASPGSAISSDSLKETITSLVKEITKLYQIKPDDSLLQQGVDSVAAITLAERLNETFHTKASQTVLFAHPTINALAAHFETLLPKALPEKNSVKIIDKSQEGCAVVGMAAHFPKSNSLQEFWKNLTEGKDCVDAIPRRRWKMNTVPKNFPATQGGFLEDIFAFDPLFFNIAPADAEKMDPQERLLLQSIAHAFEDACLCPGNHLKTGVFVASMFGHYRASLQGDDVVDYSLASLANRVSFAFNFQGPSIGVDTMCSGSLTALHLACQSLRLRECDLAVVAGVNLMPHPAKYRFLAQGNFLSTSGRCHSFGEKADGYIPGEGVGVVLLKRVANADEDQVYGVVRGSALNAGGRSAGYTVPQPVAQQAVITHALQQSGVDPSTLSYIEAHGTGTKLGDPIELEGLTSALQGISQCALGSVKSNIGHLESAAGIAGFIKVMLQLQHKTLVPTLHADPPNPKLHLDKTPFLLVEKLQPWHCSGLRRAGISAFGAGGSNAHIIVEEASTFSQNCLPHQLSYLLPLSAQSAYSFGKIVEGLKVWLSQNSIDPYALCYGYACGRPHLTYRYALIFQNIEDLREKLEHPLTPHKILEKQESKVEHVSASLETLATLYHEGGRVAWERLYPTRVVTALPLYPFEKMTCIAPAFQRVLQDYSQFERAEESLRTSHHFFVETRVAEPLHAQRTTGAWITYNLRDFAQPQKLETYTLIHLDLPEAAPLQESARLLYNLGQSLITQRAPHYLVASLRHPHPVLKGLSGFLKSLCLENSHLFIKLIESDQVVDLSVEFSFFPKRFECLVYENGGRFVKALQTISLKPSVNPFRQGGVYIITGGMGKIAQHLTKYLLKSYQAHVYLLGRSELTHERRHILREFDHYGGRVAYYVCDTASQEDVNKTVDAISKSEKGTIHGVVHTAGLLRDRLFRTKTFEDFWAVLHAKTQSAFCLHEGLKNHTLDFFVSCSSIASAYGNVGQADYALANGILDNWHNINNARTFSIQWPLWEAGGMGVSDPQAQYMQTQQGIAPLTEEEGIQLFEHILGQKTHTTVLPLKGDLEKIQKFTNGLFQNDAAPLPNFQEQGDDALKALVHEITQVPLERIDTVTPFGDYGFDSVSLTKFSEKIQSLYDVTLPPSAFFSLNTLEKLASHLAAQHPKISAEKPKVLPVLTQETRARYGIIGMDARMPGAASLEAFWSNMKNELNPVVPMLRWGNSQYQGALSPDINQFDPSFFGLSGMEAILMDPQHRLFLEVATKAILDGGYNPKALERVGVFAGVQFNDYQGLLQQHGQSRHPYAATGNAHTMLANRLSYLYDWTGPSQSIDTACSSALIALRCGILALERNECDFALVGAVSLLIDPEVTEAANSMGVLSPHFRCATFDEDADGYVRGEGIGCIFLKRYEDIVRDRDPCYGVIVSAAENHGGRAHSLTAPSPEAQKNLLLKAYDDRDLASAITTIECHGTGTKLGDPIEVDALKATWKEMGLSQNISLSSVKTHVGHLEPAAGMASLIKMLLCLKHKTLIGNLHFQKCNPYITLDHFRVLAEHESWDSVEPRTVGVSSFGFGGSNAHIVLQEAPPRDIPEIRKLPAVLICLSAKHAISLQQMRADLAHFLENLPADDPVYTLPSIAYTLQVGRGHFEYRWASVVETRDDLCHALRQPAETQRNSPRADKQDLDVPPTGDTRAYRETLEQWRRLYLEGGTLPWERLYHDLPILKVNLPTYHFHTQKYWFQEKAQGIAEVSHGT